MVDQIDKKSLLKLDQEHWTAILQSSHYIQGGPKVVVPKLQPNANVIYLILADKCFFSQPFEDFM